MDYTPAPQIHYGSNKNALKCLEGKGMLWGSKGNKRNITQKSLF